LWWWYFPPPSMCKLLLVGALWKLHQLQPLQLKKVRFFFLLVCSLGFVFVFLVWLFCCLYVLFKFWVN
jgi:hypothetical protein